MSSGSIGFDEFLLLYRKVVLPNNLYGPCVALPVYGVTCSCLTASAAESC